VSHYSDQRDAFYAEQWRKDLEHNRHRIIPKLRKLESALGALGLHGGNVISEAIDHLKYVAGYEEKS
jgi:hypothetical protein